MFITDNGSLTMTPARTNNVCASMKVPLDFQYRFVLLLTDANV